MTNLNHSTIMTTRTVRLDEDAERTLARLRKLTRLSISEVLKRGLAAYEQSALRESHLKPYDIYARLDLGAGGASLGPARDAKRLLREAIRAKHRR
jgi:hypothetical protein